VLLPSLILGSKVEGAGVLEVWWENDRLVPSLAWKLNPNVPRIKRDKREFEILGYDVFADICIDLRDGIAERSSVSNVLPREGRQAS
jgi:hypothetical protein